MTVENWATIAEPASDVQAALREQEQEFQATFDLAAIGIAHVRTDGKWLRVNQKLCEIVGYSREELLEKTFQVMTHPDDLEIDLAYVEQMLAGTIQTYSIEKRYFHKQGHLIWIRLTVSLARQPNGEPKYFIAVIEDITGRIRIEDERRRQDEKSRQIEAQFRQIAATIADVFWISEPRAKQMIYVSPAYEEIWGRSAKNLKVTFQEWRSAIHPEDQARVEQAFAQILQGEYDEEYRIIRPDGTIRWIRDRGYLTSEVSETSYISGIAQDITERKRDEDDRKQSELEIRRLNEELESRVQQRTAQLEAANKELESFSYSVSHDLRAPLRHIAGFVELLQKRLNPANLDETSARYLRTIAQTTKQAGTLIDDLLAFSRMGRSEMRLISFNMGQLLQEVKREIDLETHDRIIHWQIDPLPTVQGDPSMLRLVLQNLLENAVKYTRFCAEANIQIGSLYNETEIVFFVRDNGIGFDMRYAHKLFGIFQRLHSETQFEGTGIGLANVQRIIHRHGGRVWADSKVDRGATFYFSLPQ